MSPTLGFLPGSRGLQAVAKIWITERSRGSFALYLARTPFFLLKSERHLDFLSKDEGRGFTSTVLLNLCPVMLGVESQLLCSWYLWSPSPSGSESGWEVFRGAWGALAGILVDLIRVCQFYRLDAPDHAIHGQSRGLPGPNTSNSPLLG